MARQQQKVELEPDRLGKEAERLYEGLSSKVVGQDTAIKQVVDVYQTYMVGMHAAGRPVGSFLFLGPTGTGKTHLVESLATCLVGSPTATIKIDCGEFQHSHEIAKLIGSPPGYLGHRETHPILSQEMINQHHTEKMKLSFVLFDEIEKASDSLWHMLLGILDKAVLTLGDNRRVDFQRCLIFMTSNLGAREMESEAGGKIGFRNQAIDQAKLSGIGVNAARKRFTPEFINRIDNTAVFNSLSDQHLRKILDLELHSLGTRISVATNGLGTFFEYTVTQDAKDYLLTAGLDPRYGARHLKRAIDRHLVQPMSNLMASKQLKIGDLLVVDARADGSGLKFSKEVRKEAAA